MGTSPDDREMRMAQLQLQIADLHARLRELERDGIHDDNAGEMLKLQQASDEAESRLREIVRESATATDNRSTSH